MRVTAFTKYGQRAASTRQRLLQYLPILRAAGIDVDYRPLLDSEYIESLVTGRTYSKRRVAAVYFKRMRQVVWGPLGEVVWVYAEFFPYLPAAFEKLALRRGRRIIYDFDDAFFHSYDDNPNPLVRMLLEGKLEPLLRGASACACGNAYLQDYAARFCPNSIILPTVVDTERYKPDAARPVREAPPVIGWIGSPSTWPYMRPLLPLLRELSDAGRARIIAVGAGSDAEHDRFPGLELRRWSEENEIADLQGMDIGIMPVPEDRWARGKSGYKLIQYMACGLPAVASPVGVNREIVEPGVNGLLAGSQDEWLQALTKLLSDPMLRNRFGAAARERVVERYSLAVHGPRLVSLLQGLGSGR